MIILVCFKTTCNCVEIHPSWLPIEDEGMCLLWMHEEEKQGGVANSLAIQYSYVIIII